MEIEYRYTVYHQSLGSCIVFCNFCFTQRIKNLHLHKDLDTHNFVICLDQIKKLCSTICFQRFQPSWSHSVVMVHSIWIIHGKYLEDLTRIFCGCLWYMEKHMCIWIRFVYFGSEKSVLMRSRASTRTLKEMNLETLISRTMVKYKAHLFFQPLMFLLLEH